jgi:hypothetical protein
MAKTVFDIAVGLLVLGGPLVVLTALGARRRGNRVWSAMIARLAYPVTWVVWYTRDQHPYTRRG